MRKLTDEELSMVLSRHAAGTLDHSTYGYKPSATCGCVAGTVIDPIPLPKTDDYAIADEASEISWLLTREMIDVGNSRLIYPADADGMLRLLEKVGLA